jgi:hypothetical protein
MILNSQKGVSLVIIFLMMTIIIAMVLSMSVILSHEVQIVTGLGTSEFAFYAIDTGIEKTLYFDRKEVLLGSNRGFCNICTSCNNGTIDPANWCNNCSITPLAQGGCDPANCNNCQLDYDSSFGGDTYHITATTPNSSYPNFDMDITGTYKGAIRKVELR